jgi:hypothetical protein
LAPRHRGPQQPSQQRMPNPHTIPVPAEKMSRTTRK